MCRRRKCVLHSSVIFIVLTHNQESLMPFLCFNTDSGNHLRILQLALLCDSNGPCKSDSPNFGFKMNISCVILEFFFVDYRCTLEHHVPYKLKERQALSRELNYPERTHFSICLLYSLSHCGVISMTSMCILDSQQCTYYLQIVCVIFFITTAINLHY